MLAVKQDQIEAQLAKAEKLNLFLVNLTRGDVMASESRTTKRSAIHHTLIRTHALVIADALRKKLLGKECLCGMRHNANLVIGVPATCKKFRMPNFRVLFGFDAPSTDLGPLPWTNLEMDIAVVEESATISIPEKAKCEVLTVDEEAEKDLGGKKRFREIFRSRSPRNCDPKSQPKGDQIITSNLPITSTSKAQRQVRFANVLDGEKANTQTEIDDLCAEIITTKGKDSWYGVLVRKMDARHEIRIATTPYFPSQCLKVTSLAELLSSKIWRIQNRSRLGLQLASSVLQLYQTPWLPENWGKNDVLFIQDVDGRVVTDKPFLRPHFMTRITAEVRTVNTNVPYLFALGVLLLELHYKTPIEELQEKHGLASERNEVSQMVHTEE